MATIPPFILAVLYWLHMLATVCWIGGLAAMALFVLPAAHKTLPGEMYSAFLLRLEASLQRLGWICLAVLIFTGMFQMSAHPSYEGFLAINNAWSSAILFKHLVIGVMVGSSAYLTWGLLPELNRLGMMQQAGKAIPADRVKALQRRETWLLRANLAISALILLLTALARSS